MEPLASRRTGPFPPVRSRTMSVQRYAPTLARLSELLRTEISDADYGRGLERAVSVIVRDGGWAVPGIDPSTLDQESAEVLRSAIEYAEIQMQAALDAPGIPLGRAVQEAARLAGEHLLAMQIAGEPEERIAIVREVLESTITNGHLAGRVREVAEANGLSIEAMAPAVMAAVLAVARPGDRDLSISGAIRRYNLDRGSKLPERMILPVAEVLAEYLRFGETSILPVLASDRTPPGLEADEPQVPDALVAFESSRRGGDARARIEGVRDLLRAQTVAEELALEIQGVQVDRATAAAFAPGALARLGPVLRQERAIHTRLTRKNAEILHDLTFQRRRDPHASAAPLFREATSPLEARALYLRSAAEAGVPLGQLLALIHDSPHAGVGPTEGTFFSRAAFYGARKYAANFGAQDDRAIDELVEHGAHPVRVAEIRDLIREVEIEIRRMEAADDTALRGHARRRLEAYAEDGALTEREHTHLMGIEERLVLRSRAAQEVRLLTAFVAASGGDVKASVLRGWGDLPHSRAFALSPDRGTHAWGVRTELGMDLHEMELDTRSRWMAYRQRASAGQDVVSLSLPEEAAEALRDPVELRRPLPQPKPVHSGGRDRPLRSSAETRSGTLKAGR